MKFSHKNLGHPVLFIEIVKLFFLVLVNNIFLLLFRSGGEDGQSQQVYLIDDKSLTTEAGLSQLMKTNLVSTSNLMSTQQKLVQSQSQGTHSSQASSTSQTSENEGNAAQEKSTQSTQAVPQFQHFTARQVNMMEIR